MPSRDDRHGSRPSLWLLPDASPQLTTLLAQLAADHGGPPFAPHLTLLGSADGTLDALHSQAERLAERLSPMTLPTAGVHGSKEWFRCITLHIAQDPVLMAARAEAERCCGTDVRPWVPHISLLYGHLSTTDRAAAIAGLPPRPPTVRLSALALVETIGPAECWIERARFPLSRG